MHFASNEFISWDLCLECHLQLAVLYWLILLGGPVHVALFLSLLHGMAQHDNIAALELPNHSPEVIHSGLKWALSGDVGITNFVALRTAMSRRKEERKHQWN